MAAAAGARTRQNGGRMDLSPARRALRSIALSGLVLALGALPAAANGAPPAEARAAWFLDGDRRVDVERLAAEPAAPALTPVRLRYAGRAHAVRAFVDRTAIVTLPPGIEPRLDDLGARPLRALMPSAGLWLVEDTRGGDGIDVARRLRDARAPGVIRAVPNLYLERKIFGAHTPSDPRYPGQWFFANLKMPEAWGRTLGDDKTTIVVVDTGCDLQHPDLVSKIDPGLDVADGDMDPSPDPSQKGAAHGTSCAGLAAASTDNGEGIAGGCPACRLRCVRLLSDDAVPISADVEAYQFALDVDAAVISNSWGFTQPMPVPTPLETAINNVFDNGRGGRGALVLFAMGNDDRVIGDDELEAVRGVLGIGAINNFDEQTPFTNSGNSVDLVAPTGTLTTDLSGPAGDDPSDYTSLFGGTSSACPVAAGIAGLLVSAAPDRTSQELYDVLIKTARPAPFATPDANGHDQVYGFGIIDPVKALDEVLPKPVADAGADAGPGPTDDEGGCSCSQAPAPPAGAAFYAVGMALAAARARRRRR
ncbi:MAG: S8 family serine peptidase [Minicystis sp.]